MWALGIIHNQMTVASILYDKSRDEVKIVDYSRAYMPEDLKTFQIGVLSDLSWFTMSFVLAALNPEYLESPQRFYSIPEEVINYIRTTSIELNPDLREINIGKLPVSPKVLIIYGTISRS
eukprot:UN13057